LVKPVRIQQCKALVQKMKKRTPASKDAPVQSGLANYENLKFLGQGAAGAVSLVRNKQDGLLYALKAINLNFLNEKDRRNAESEAQFLRVLSGPTLISYHESFIDKNNIYIVMEYAENGCLSSRIEQYRVQGKKFGTETILIYMAEMTLGLLAMHSKNILHRDIKTQNIFITASEVLKIGDFGISREVNSQTAKIMTSCGTPYFMPPEVIQGKPYDNKADIWALGIILYELITFKKPFDDETINGVFDKIVRSPYEPLPAEIDSDLKMLVAALLNKDHRKRPNVFDLANIPCIRSRIQQFVEKYNCEEQVMSVFVKEKAGPKQDLQTATESQVSQYLLNEDQLEELTGIIRNDITIRDYKNGWFGSFKRCAQGCDIIGWILEHVEQNEKKARTICAKMVETEMVRSVSGETGFDPTGLYQFYMDRDDIPDNMIRRWKGDVRDALEVSVSLVKKMDDIYAKSFVEIDDQSKSMADHFRGDRCRFCNQVY